MNRKHTVKTARNRKKAGRRKPAVRAVAKPEPGLRAADLMTREPITVPQDMTLADLCDLFQERNINGAPVVDERGLLVGVVAQDDIIYGAMGRPIEGAGESPARRRRRGMVEALRERSQKAGEAPLRAVPDARPRTGERAFWADMRAEDDPMRMPVRSIMTSPAISAEEKTPITDLCNVMWNLRIHRVPIVRGGKVTGLISSMDLCRAILNGQIKV
jgi:CBS domain-containing protein